MSPTPVLGAGRMWTKETYALPHSYPSYLVHTASGKRTQYCCTFAYEGGLNLRLRVWMSHTGKRLTASASEVCQ